MKKYILFSLLAILALTGCKNSAQTTAEEEVPVLVGPTFNADTAMALCAAQCDFGPRTMNSEAHDRCEAWIIQKFKQYGCEVSTQKADLKGWDGTTLRSTNIIASLNPGASRHLLICAHWDCRPWADNDPDSTNWRKPVLAANDAASGVGVMLEMARILAPHVCDSVSTDSLALPGIGIDFVCFDAEDYGAPDWSGMTDTEDTWALGAQYFAKNAPRSYEAGILLDMVGGQGAHFYQEQLSKRYAPNIVEDVWSAAYQAGYSSLFLNESGGMITDDHKPLNEAGIPTIDIIPYYPDCEQSAFGPTWHTINDDMQHLDKETLKAVGQTVIQYIYR